MPGLSDLPGDVVVSTYVAGNATAATPDEFPLFRAPYNLTVTAVYFIAKATVTGAATNYFSLTVRNRTTGAGAVNVANLDFSSAPIVATAFAPLAITLSATAANLNCAQGDGLTSEKLVTGSGLAMPTGIVVVHYRIR